MSRLNGPQESWFWVTSPIIQHTKKMVDEAQPEEDAAKMPVAAVPLTQAKQASEEIILAEIKIPAAASSVDACKTLQRNLFEKALGIIREEKEGDSSPTRVDDANPDVAGSKRLSIIARKDSDQAKQLVDLIFETVCVPWRLGRLNMIIQQTQPSGNSLHSIPYQSGFDILDRIHQEFTLIPVERARDDTDKTVRKFRTDLRLYRFHKEVHNLLLAISDDTSPFHNAALRTYILSKTSSQYSDPITGHTWPGRPWRSVVLDFTAGFLGINTATILRSK